MNKQITILVDTLRVEGYEIKSIYNLDAFVHLTLSHGNTVLTIKEPSLDVLAQINELRPQYNLIYRVA
jgi:hypothetical protein